MKWKKIFECILRAMSDNSEEVPQEDKGVEEKTLRNEENLPAAPSWWQKENAKYFRDQYPEYLFSVFLKAYDMQKALIQPLERFYRSCGKWWIHSHFPEIHTYLVCVRVYGLRTEWSDRAINLREALLSELSRTIADCAIKKRLDLTENANALVLNVWLRKDTLFLEIPYSLFPVKSPYMAGILATEKYRNLKRALDCENEL